jgi:regulation of enolase protein 1 (concanavalin A-like superfamily)
MENYHDKHWWTLEVMPQRESSSITKRKLMTSEVPDNWREEMIGFTSDPSEIKLLREGPTSWTQSVRLGIIKSRYKKIMGIKDPEPVDCQSNFKEWNEQTKSL